VSPVAHLPSIASLMFFWSRERGPPLIHVICPDGPVTCNQWGLTCTVGFYHGLLIHNSASIATDFRMTRNSTGDHRQQCVLLCATDAYRHVCGGMSELPRRLWRSNIRLGLQQGMA
jgi:hypothetical protein